MAFSHSPKIVTDGLVLCLDAGNPKSYPGSGTTWKDLSGNGYNETLTNGPTFDSGNGGSIAFDGSDDLIAQSYNMSSMSEFSILIWAKTFDTGSISADNNAALAGPNAGGTYIRTGFSHNSQRLSILMYVNGNENNVFTSVNIPYSSFDESGYNLYVCSIKDNVSMNIYFNAELKQTTSIGSAITTGLNSWYQRLGNYANAFKWNGVISKVQLYTRLLTASEIQQNYNATKGRFGL